MFEMMVAGNGMNPARSSALLHRPDLLAAHLGSGFTSTAPNENACGDDRADSSQNTKVRMSITFPPVSGHSFPLTPPDIDIHRLKSDFRCECTPRAPIGWRPPILTLSKLTPAPAGLMLRSPSTYHR